MIDELAPLVVGPFNGGTLLLMDERLELLSCPAFTTNVEILIIHVGDQLSVVNVPQFMAKDEELIEGFTRVDRRCLIIFSIVNEAAGNLIRWVCVISAYDVVV